MEEYKPIILKEFYFLNRQITIELNKNGLEVGVWVKHMRYFTYFAIAFYFVFSIHVYTLGENRGTR